MSSFADFGTEVAEKLKMSQTIKGQGVHLGSPIDMKKKKHFGVDVEILFQDYQVFLNSAVAEESKMSQPIRGNGDQLGSLIFPKTQIW